MHSCTLVIALVPSALVHTVNSTDAFSIRAIDSMLVLEKKPVPKLSPCRNQTFKSKSDNQAKVLDSIYGCKFECDNNT